MELFSLVHRVKHAEALSGILCLSTAVERMIAADDNLDLTLVGDVAGSLVSSKDKDQAR